MTINYGSPAHIMYIAIALLFCFVLFIILRKRSKQVQKYAVLAIMIVNAAQHIFKTWIYPQYDGLGFTALNTAYNMCAFLILASPIALLLKSDAFRDFVFYIGTSAGILALLIPYWNIGDYAFEWEVIRFFICHAFLFSSSLLPLLLGLHKPSYKSFYKLGACFMISLVVILINDAICVLLGIYPGIENMSVGEALYIINPVWTFKPADVFVWVGYVAEYITPAVWMGDNAAGMYIPILWYLIPVYILITLIAFPICTLADRKRFKNDISKLFTKK